MRNAPTGTAATAAMMIVAILVVVFVYRPVVHAGFVWDDLRDFRDMAWLSHGDAWKHYIFKGFNDWTNYFRPFAVALFTAQVRLFDSTPGPMHAVSLGMHAAATLLVGLLSWRFSDAAGDDTRRKTVLVAASMLLYGLHPVLVEPVAWIGCQFDLIATLFILLGLLANVGIERRSVRVVAVSACFFLAACAKESAAAFPLILAAVDWAVLGRNGSGFRPTLHAFVRKNGATFVAMLATGVGYLVFRHWALGQILNPVSNDALTLFGRLQEACFLYLRYWRMLVAPMLGMSPVHPVDVAQFNEVSASSLLIDATALGAAGAGLYFALMRASAAGAIVVVMTVSLLPVLRIIPTDFDESLYHERYVMTSLAVICAMLPLLRMRMRAEIAKPVRGLLGVAVCLWLAMSAIATRATLPRWTDNVSLWRWALVVNPDAVSVKDNLLAAYIDNGRIPEAHALVDWLMTNRVSCANCMLNAAILALNENNPDRAEAALEEVRQSNEVAADRHMLHMYLYTTGRMLILRGEPADAAELFRAAIDAAPLDPNPRMALALSLAALGKPQEAREMGESGLVLFTDDDKRNAARRDLERALDSNVDAGRKTDPAGH